MAYDKVLRNSESLVEKIISVEHDQLFCNSYAQFLICSRYYES